MNNSSLFSENYVHLSALDEEIDAEPLSDWTHHPEMTLSNDLPPTLPQSEEQIRKKIREAKKDPLKETWFMCCEKVENRQLAMIGLRNLDWTNGAASISIQIGPEGTAHPAYIEEALQIILNYAYTELNLYRIGIILPEYAVRLSELFQKIGFIFEVRRREALYFNLRWWDLYMYGLTREEWIQTPYYTEYQNDGSTLISR